MNTRRIAITAAFCCFTLPAAQAARPLVTDDAGVLAAANAR